MQITEVDGPIFGRSRAHHGLGAVVERIGGTGFDQAFMQYAASLCDAEHFALYAIGEDEGCRVIGSGGPTGCVQGEGTAKRQACLYSSGGFWRVDPALSPVWAAEPDCRPMLVHMDVEEIEHAEMRQRVYGPHGVRERMVLSARSPRQTVVISFINTYRRGPFGADHLRAVERMADNMVAMAIKHVDMRQASDDASSALTSLNAIEACLNLSTPRLARREAEVCARILYGMTSLGIALDLGIGEESAMTYRKRAYSRLKIGSQRELLLWYLDQWSKQRTTVFSGLH